MDFYTDFEGKRVQAMLLTPELITVASVWASAIVVEEIDALDDSKRYPALNLRTRNGVRRAAPGVYIVKHSDGDFDLMTPGAFKHRYNSEN